MGEVSSINTVFDDKNQSIQCVMITIELDRHNYAERRCVFNKVVTHLDEKLTLLGVESKAMVATNINPKLAGYNLLYLYLVFKLDNTTTVYMLAQSLISGWLFFNATFETHYYVDHEVLASQCFLKEFCGAKRDYLSTPSKYGGVKKIENVTLAELNMYVLNSRPTAVFPIGDRISMQGGSH